MLTEMVPMLTASTAPISFYGLIGLAFYLFILSIIDMALSRWIIIDDIVRVILVALGIGGVIIAIPFIGIIGSLLQQLVTFLIGLIPNVPYGSTAAQVLLVVAFIVLNVLTIKWYVTGRHHNRKPDVEQVNMKLRTLVLVVTLSPIYGIDAVRKACNWIINPVGVSGWNVLVSIFNAFNKWHPNA